MIIQCIRLKKVFKFKFYLIWQFYFKSWIFLGTTWHREENTENEFLKRLTRWRFKKRLTGQLCSENDPPIESWERDGVGEDFSENLGSIPDLARSISTWTSLIRLSRSLSCWTRATFLRCSPTRTLRSFSRLDSRMSC